MYLHNYGTGTSEERISDSDPYTFYTDLDPDPGIFSNTDSDPVPDPGKKTSFQRPYKNLWEFFFKTKIVGRYQVPTGRYFIKTNTVIFLPMVGTV